MGKSHGNYVGINEKPEIMFGKIMSVPDNLIVKYVELLTDLDLDKMSAETKRSAGCENGISQRNNRNTTVNLLLKSRRRIYSGSV